jgi:hypothetical protein
LLAVLIVPLALAACDAGTGSRSTQQAERPSTAAAEPPSPTARSLVARHRPAISRALARDARCLARACSTPSGLQRRAKAIAGTVAPLDDALGRVPTAEAKRQRVPTSVVRHAARQLESCVLLSARKHGGRPTLEECRGPVAEFREAVAALREGILESA